MDDLPQSPTKKLPAFGLNKIFVAILVASVVLGGLSGYMLASGKKTSAGSNQAVDNSKPPSNAQQDNRTFRDFAEGMVQKRPESKKSDEYVEGTHILVREKADSVALTSSVVDLSQYEGKKVKVFGETQKAIKEGWLMDVGKVELK